MRLSYCLQRSPDSKERQEAEHRIIDKLMRNRGDVAKTAIALGVGRATLHRWLTDNPVLERELAKARTQPTRKK